MRLMLTAWLLIALASAASAQQPAQIAPSDYSIDANWLCKPGRADACAVDLTATVVEASGSMHPEPFTRAENPPVDCFYVYPTVSSDPGANSDLTANEEELRVAASQFARFSSVCRPYAPLYRQITLGALRRSMAGQAPDPAVGAMAYADVAAAFHYYIQHENHGRQFVLIGHSQGSRMLQLLVQREIDGKPLQQHMLSAILLGFNLAVPEGRDVGGDFANVPLCRAPAQIGCVVTYVSFRADAPPPANSRFGVAATPGMQIACTNPAALAGGDDAVLDSYLGARGAGQSSRLAGPWVQGGAPVNTAFVKAPGLLSGRCVHDEHGAYFAVTVHGDPSDPRTDVIVGDIVVGDRVLADWGLHLLDVSETQGDLIALVRSQTAGAH